MNKSAIIARFFALILLFLSYAAFYSQAPIKDLKPTVILISLDGFRYDYLDKYKPPTLNKLARAGVRAKWMIPSFPTKTFPNHYTIATGLYPEHHGIVENNIWDFDTTFSLDKREEVQNSRWWLGEPVWVTAEKQGLRSAAFFFPGTEAEIAGQRPTFWKEFDNDIPNETRVDQILAWLDLPRGERPQFFTLYFSDTDSAGHEFSPDSPQTRAAVGKVDAAIRRLMAGLEAQQINRRVNVVIVSDHGMAPVNVRNATFLDDYFNFDLTERILWTNEIVQIFPKERMTDDIFSKIKNLQHATCWKKADIPARLHYNEGRRIAPIVCSSQEGWITTNHKRYKDWLVHMDDPTHPRGAHGYDNRYQSMQATFIASGPAFKKGYIAKPFSNVEIYNVLCRILGLKPAKNDGNLKHVRGMLR